MALRRRTYLAEYRKALSGSTVTAFHCGRDIGSGKFSMKFAGAGEGYANPPLGPGIYFATDRDIAKLYCKYAPNPYFYEVKIQTKGLYTSTWGNPKALGDRLDKLYAKVAPERSKKYKTDPIREVARALGRAGALKAFAGIGLTGAWEGLAAGGEEIAVFDPSIIKIVRKERMQ